MTQPVWLTEDHIRTLGSIEESIDILAAAYAPETQAHAVTMQRGHARSGETILHSVGGVLGSERIAGTKTWVYSPRGASPLLLLFSLEDGSLLAAIEAFTLGLWRTAATTGLATRLLARDDAQAVAVVGTGKQALSQLTAVAAVRPPASVRVFGRDAGRLAAFGRRAREQIGAEFSLHTELAAALDGADVVVTITRSADPFFGANLVQSGMHINAIGAIVPSRSELTGDAVARCDVVVTDSPLQAQADSGELRAAAADGALDFQTIRSLAEVVADPGRGRRTPAEVTLFKALGVGLSDVALGVQILGRAREAGIGASISTSHAPAH